MTNDLTKGSPAKLILFFTIPYLLGNIFQQLYNIADTVIVGRTLGVNALAAVGATGSLCWFFMGFVQGFTSGFSVITAQCFGAGNHANVKKSFSLSLVLTFILTAILTIFSCVFCRKILVFLGTPADIIDDSYKYIMVILAGLIVTAMSALLSSMIRALGNSRTPLILSVIACAINIVLDFTFILVFKMGIIGAALATLIAQIFSAIGCAVYIYRKMPELHFSKSDFRYDAAFTKNLLRTGLPMGFLNMVISLGGITIQWVTNSLGTTCVASYTAASKLDTINNQPVQSFGASISVYVAQNYGCRNIARIKEGIRKTLMMTYIWTLISSLLMIFFGRFLVTAVVGSAENTIIENARLFLVINSAMMILLSPVVIYKSTLQSLGRAGIPILSGFIEVFCRAFVAVVFATQYGFTGLCFASPFAWFGALIVLAFDYFRAMKELGTETVDGAVVSDAKF